MKDHFRLILILAGSLAFLGILGSFCHAFMLYRRDGHPIGLIVWAVIWGGGLLAVWKPFKMIFHILNK